MDYPCRTLRDKYQGYGRVEATLAAKGYEGFALT